MDVGAVCRRKDHRRDGHRPSRSGPPGRVQLLISRLHCLGTWFRESPPHTRRTHRAAAGVLLVSLPGVTPGVTLRVTPGTITNGRASPAMSPRPPPPGATPAAGASAPGRVRGYGAGGPAGRPAGRPGGGRRRETGRRACLVSGVTPASASRPRRTRACSCLDHAPPPAAGAVERRSRPGVPRSRNLTEI